MNYRGYPHASVKYKKAFSEISKGCITNKNLIFNFLISISNQKMLICELCDILQATKLIQLKPEPVGVVKIVFPWASALKM